MRLIALFVVSGLAAAQQIGQNVPPGGSGVASFTSSTQLVVETVSVTGRSGTPVTGLTAKDFAITENGAPQQIRVCEEQKLPEASAAALADRSREERIHVYDKLTRTQSVPE